MEMSSKVWVPQPAHQHARRRRHGGTSHSPARAEPHLQPWSRFGPKQLTSMGIGVQAISDPDLFSKDSLSFPNAELSFMAEIDKHIVTNFSSLDLHLRTKGHVFGAIVLHLLGLHPIRTSIRNLKIVLLGSEVKDACPLNCPCEEPMDRRTQSISLANLEKVQIEGVKGENHEFYFLQEIFRCAPMLRRVALRLSDEATPGDYWCMKINDIPKAYPNVECTVDFAPGPTFSSQTCAST